MSRIKTPEWVKDAVFYQIFPDRFARSARLRHPPGIALKPWRSPPSEQGFQGGDLLGIVDRLDYLGDLGVTALYLNPVFTSASNHRYHTYDYMQVDPLLGGNDALRELLDAAHARGIRVVLDGVFNHTGRGFWAFHHLLENGPRSPYVDWYFVKAWPLHPYAPRGEKKPLNYECWWNLPALPKLNVRNPGVREHLLHVARHWIDFGIDGWRLDVPEEIDDPEFWRSFRATVKEGDPEAYLVGEIWNEAPDWLEGDRFDAVMNYPLSRAAHGFFGARTLARGYRPGGHELKPLDAAAFGNEIDRVMSLYPEDVTLAQLNVLDSHDTARLLWAFGGDKSALSLCVVFQMTMPGAPCVYYGDEIGMTGGPDPDCRRAFPWEDRAGWDEGLLDVYKRAIAMRREHAVLRRGSFRRMAARDDLYAFHRSLGGCEAVVALNAGSGAATLGAADLASLGSASGFAPIWGDVPPLAQALQGEGVRLPPRDAAVWVGGREDAV